MKVKLVFSWFYKQNKSLVEISQKTKLSVEEIEEIQINPIYFGKIFFEGTIQQANHEPIINELYCKINNINVQEIEEKFLASKQN